ncbi:hypothetical protein C5167_013106 [Papaver somniferum]|uniref:Uncharacterized protein n=1 Tax=Papaver somniferum TaxID=3469 RepID=A0A4Y7J3D8_PAPSO|nr:hypothetical protein C5167_013106 [Papaver somniferum]
MKKTPKDLVSSLPLVMHVGHRKGSLLLPYSEHEKYMDPELQVDDGNEKCVVGSEENVGAGSSVNKEHIANE